MPGHTHVGPHHECPSCGRSFDSQGALEVHLPECITAKDATPEGAHRQNLTDETRTDRDWISKP